MFSGTLKEQKVQRLTFEKCCVIKRKRCDLHQFQSVLERGSPGSRPFGGPRRAAIFFERFFCDVAVQHEVK
jgi:hypothetical protein